MILRERYGRRGSEVVSGMGRGAGCGCMTEVRKGEQCGGAWERGRHCLWLSNTHHQHHTLPILLTSAAAAATVCRRGLT